MSCLSETVVSHAQVGCILQVVQPNQHVSCEMPSSQAHGCPGTTELFRWWFVDFAIAFAREKWLIDPSVSFVDSYYSENTKKLGHPFLTEHRILDRSFLMTNESSLTNCLPPQIVPITLGAITKFI